MIVLAKQITWGAVLVLVLLEIVVSIKVGGAPFDIGKVKLPSVGFPNIFQLMQDSSKTVPPQ